MKSLNARMESGCNPDIKQLPKGQQVKNAHSTGDDDPCYRESWIDYWKAFATEDIPDVCPLCGKSMTGDDSKGCHVLIKSKSAIGDGYGEKKYIIPGHQKCNCQFGEEFDLKIDIKAVEAIKKQ